MVNKDRPRLNLTSPGFGFGDLQVCEGNIQFMLLHIYLVSNEKKTAITAQT